MTTLFLDLETYCETPIKNGAHRYAEDAEVLLVAYAFDDEPVVVLDTSDDWPSARGRVQMLIDTADRVVIHNSAFDRTVLRHKGVHVPVEKVVDTMMLALQHSLPASLGTLCDVLGVPVDKAKDKDGKKLIQLFCKPRPKNVKLRRATRETHPDEWQRFIEYARLDVDAMRHIHGLLPDWNDTGSERNLWQFDQRTNDRGIRVDVDLARAALRAFERTLRSLATRTGVLTNGAVSSATQRNAFLSYLQTAHGFTETDLTGETVSKMLATDLSPELRELLEIRQQASATSPAKYKALLDAASSDGRLRGAIQFCGAARTGRDAGRIFQPQNLPRTPDWFDGEVQEMTVSAFKHDAEDILWSNVSDRCVMAVRGCLIADPGNKLVIADLSNIEGRVLAWLAGEQWKVEAFKAYDRGEGHDLYKVTAGRILGKDPGDVTKPERQTQGKVPELAGGYGGGLGAYRKMGGEVFNAMSDEAIGAIVQAWRAAHPATKRLWYDVEGAARSAVRSPEESFEVRGLLRFDMKRGPDGADWMRLRLPSGRFLCYRKMHINDGRCPDCNGNGEVMTGPVERGVMIPAFRTGRVCPTCDGSGRGHVAGQLLYEGMNQYTRKWEWLETYYGKLCLAQGTLVLTDTGWLPIEHVSTTHKLWDGASWVAHEGLVRKGIKEVMCLNGVWMTPDHEVLSTEGWVRASQSEGLERADARVPDGFELPRQRWQPIAVVAPLRMREGNNSPRDRNNEAAEARRASVLRVYEKADDLQQTENARDVSAQGVCGVAEHARPLWPTYASGLEKLRRSRYRGVRGVASFLLRLLGRYGSDVQGGADAGAPRQFRRIQPAELRMGDVQAAGSEQETQRVDKHAVGADHSRGGSRQVGSEQDDTLLSGQRRGAGQQAVRGTRHIAEVYDLVNSGPLRRFVVAGESGDTMIVHNCENVVQAIARDVFMAGMRYAEANGYPVVLRVHDELVCEVPDTPEYTADRLSEFMATNPVWSVGLPLAAEGFECKRYRK